MKILVIADHEEKALWDYWSEQTADRLSEVGLILSAGDLDANYLEFLVTMLNVPLVYVHGNHDESYLKQPPEGCIDADGKLVNIRCGPANETIRILGLGGSMRYQENAPCMYSEEEMQKRMKGLRRSFLKERIRGRQRGRTVTDILLTHAPCKGYGDLEDLPHRGFACFNDFLNLRHPGLHVYGHVHREYGNSGSAEDPPGFHRLIRHPSGATLVNADGCYILDYASFADKSP